jgi:hypothetical protein
METLHPAAYLLRSPAMRIINQVPFEAVVQAWLKAEWFADFFNPIRIYIPQSLIDDEDFSNQQNNELRYWLLHTSRFPLLDTLPSNVTWYSAAYDRADIKRTYVVASNEWGPISGNTYRADVVLHNINTAGNPAAKIRDVKASLASVDRRLILVASDINFILTIVEGNHRAIAIFSDADDRGTRDPIIPEVFVGVSPDIRQYMFSIEKYMALTGLSNPHP